MTPLKRVLLLRVGVLALAWLAWQLPQLSYVPLLMRTSDVDRQAEARLLKSYKRITPERIIAPRSGYHELGTGGMNATYHAGLESLGFNRTYLHLVDRVLEEKEVALTALRGDLAKMKLRGPEARAAVGDANSKIGAAYLILKGATPSKDFAIFLEFERILPACITVSAIDYHISLAGLSLEHSQLCKLAQSFLVRVEDECGYDTIDLLPSSDVPWNGHYVELRSRQHLPVTEDVLSEAGQILNSSQMSALSAYCNIAPQYPSVSRPP